MKSYLAWMNMAVLSASGLLAAGCSSSSGDDAPAVEQCNGIDDNGDGLIDEGCACTAFSVEVPFRVNAAVSLGVGWALATNGLADTKATATQAGYARIDDAGAVQAMQPLAGVTWSQKQQLAWNGTELAYLAGSPRAAHVSFLTVDGVKSQDGPALDISTVEQAPHPIDGRLQTNATGYDVAFSTYSPTASMAGFVSTDHDGKQLATPLDPPVGDMSYAFALGAVAGQAMVGWVEVANGGAKPSPAFAGVPFAKNQIDAIGNTGGADFPGRDGASNGSEMLLILADDVRTFDGTTSTLLTLPAELPRAIAWTGDQYELAEFNSSSSVMELRLDRDHSVVSSTQLVRLGSGSTGIDAVVAADARRVLVGATYQNQAGEIHQVLTQVCL